MKVTGATLDHVGIAVKDASAAARLYGDALGLAGDGVEVLTERSLKVVFFDAGGVKVELLEGLGGDVISKFIATRGEGLHHICFRVEDIDEAAASLREDGYEFITKEPYAGAHSSRVIFMKPASAFGVLIELKQQA